MYMDGLKLFAKNVKELHTLINALRIYSQDIVMKFGINKMCFDKNKKQQTKLNWTAKRRQD